MRTTTSQQDVVLGLATRSVHTRVWVDRGSGDWVDLTDLADRDWVRGVEYSGSVDRSPAVANIQVQNRIEDLSLSPLMSGSKLNASGVVLELGHPIYVEAAVMPRDTAPSSGDWVEVFRGEIDEIEWNANPIRIRCRDQSGALDRFVETQYKRPLDLNVDHVENVMQEIIDVELGEGVVTLYSITGTAADPFKVADSPNWLIPAYIQKKQPIIQALKVLADQIGWVVRYLWNTSTSAFELTFYEPGRELAAQGSLLLTGIPTAGADSFVVNATTIDAVAGAPAVDEFQVGSDAEDTADNIVAALALCSEAGNLSKSWATGPTYASGTMTFTGQPGAAETFVINATTITAVAGAPTANQFQIGGNLTATLDNLVTTLNTTCDEQGNLAATRIGSTVKITWGTAGSAGDAIVFTEALSNCTIDGGGTLGGTDIGIDARVTIEWGAKGTAGNAIVFTESLDNCTADGGGTLGGTILGQGTSIDHTFGPDRYHGVRGLRLSRSGIRNVVKVKYGVSQLDRTTVTVTDSSSISKYGRRYMELAEAGSSQIDTESEATRMANAALADLAEPNADQTLELPYFWPVESGDYYRFEANAYHYDADQDLAVVAWRHELSETRSRTTLTCRGKPSGGYKRWLGIEARPGVAPQNSFYGAAAATGSVASQGVGLVVVTYDDPRGMAPPINDWAFTKCHVDTSGGFTPSDSNLVAVGRTTRFDVGGLIPGTTYYIKLVIIDGAGNEAAVSTQISTAAEKVGAYHENGDTLRIDLCANGTFGQATKPLATDPPDGWTVSNGSWDTEVGYSEQVSATGGRSLALYDAGGGDGAVLSDYIPVTPDQPYVLHTYLRASDTHNDNRAKILLAFYDSSKTSIATYEGQVTLQADWYRHGLVTIPQYTHGQYPTARYLRVGVKRFEAGGGATTYTAYCDRVHVFKGMHRFTMNKDNAQSLAAGVPARVTYNGSSDFSKYETAARGTMTLTGLPIAAETFLINVTTVTAVAGAPAADQFQIGSDSATTAANIVTALNTGSEAANLTAWREDSRVIIDWDPEGAGGDAIVFTEAMTNTAVDGGGTLGGTQAGGIVYGADHTTIPGRFTCSQAGDYTFLSAVGFDDLSDGTMYRVEYRKNGAVVHKGERNTTGAAGDHIATASVTLALIKDDYVEVWAEHNDGAGAKNTLTGVGDTYFTGTREAGDE